VLVLAILASAAPATSDPPACAGEVPAQALATRGPAAVRAAATRRPPTDVDDVALLVDEGDLVVRRNPLDLAGRSIRLEPAEAGYRRAALQLPLEPVGTPLQVTDSSPVPLDLPFAFPFLGAAYRSVWVHADGHLTFEAPDPGTPGVLRLVDGPPRIAALYSDLDLSRGGLVGARLEDARVIVTWSDVPSSGRVDRNTVAAVLHASGTIDLVFGELGAAEAFVGATPGRGAALGLVDLTSPGAVREGAVLERFSEQESLDLVAATGRFAAGWPGAYDQLVVYTSRALNPLGGTFAFEVTLRNRTAGIGTPELEAAGSWGAGPALQSVVFMDTVRVYRDVDGFEVLGHEVGHRWLASLSFHPRAGETGRELMSGDGVHWSFFCDTDASVLGGNDTVASGGGRYETSDVARRFGPLDQYAMGLRTPADVEPTVFFARPDNFRPSRSYKSSTSPEVGVSFSAVPRPVAIGEVTAAMGPRQGPDDETARNWRIAFALVSEPSDVARAEHLRVVARIRRNFEPWFEVATGGRGRVLTRLR
jgi:hypothetical protein